jgi:hypothetical protein
MTVDLPVDTGVCHNDFDATVTAEPVHNAVKLEGHLDDAIKTYLQRSKY